MKGKYEVNQFIGVPLETDDSGQYRIKRDESGDFSYIAGGPANTPRESSSRSARFFITENNLMVGIIKAIPVAFKDRHQYTPLQRFTSEYVSDEVLNAGKKKLEK